MEPGALPTLPVGFLPNELLEEDLCGAYGCLRSLRSAEPLGHNSTAGAVAMGCALWRSLCAVITWMGKANDKNKRILVYSDKHASHAMQYKMFIQSFLRGAQWKQLKQKGVMTRMFQGS